MDSAKTYIQQSLLWLFGFMTLVVLVFVLALKPTIRQKQELQLLNAQASAYLSWKSEQSSVQEVVRLMGNYQDVEHQLFNLISTQAKREQITIESFEAPHQVVQSGLLISTYTIELSGTFHGMLTMTHLLETQFDGASVAGFFFNKVKGLHRGNEKLILTIYIQSISEKT